MIDLEKQLIQAIEDGNLSSVESLLDRGAPVDATGRGGLLAIHFAVSNQNQSILKLLLEKGAGVHASDISGLQYPPINTAVAAQPANLDIVKVLLDHFDKEAMDELSVDKIHPTPVFHLAAVRGNLDVVRLLLDRGVRVDVQDYTGCTALHQAALIQGNRLVMCELLQWGCYSYPNDEHDHYIEKYWESNPMNTPADELLCTSMLLAGVTMRMESVTGESKELKAFFTTIQNNIVSTVVNWLAPLALSRDKVFEATPAVLRAFHRLIHWLACVDNSASKKLGPWLFKKAENGEKDEALTALFTKLNSIPTELKDLVREDFNQSVLADLLVGRLNEIYGLEKCIAQYLVTKVMGHLQEYRAFHTRLWEHDWHISPCEPPIVGSNSTAAVTHSLQSLRF